MNENQHESATPSHVDETPTDVDTVSTAIDLVAIEQDLADVEIALSRLEAGTYWTCEVTGNDIPDSVLEQRPTSRVANLPR